MARRERGADLAGERDSQEPLLVRRTRAGERGHQEPALEDAAAFRQQLEVAARRQPVGVRIPRLAGRGDRPVVLQPGGSADPRDAVLEAAASLLTGAGANAARAATGAGAMASSSDHHVTASGSAPTSAEMV